MQGKSPLLDRESMSHHFPHCKLYRHPLVMYHSKSLWLFIHLVLNYCSISAIQLQVLGRSFKLSRHSKERGLGEYGPPVPAILLILIFNFNF